MEGYLTPASLALTSDVGEGYLIGDPTMGIGDHAPGQTELDPDGWTGIGT